MRPSKTQAQKAAERAEKQAEIERVREEEKAARAEFNRKQSESQPALDASSAVASKADKRKAKKAKKAAAKLSSVSEMKPILPGVSEIALASKSITEVLDTHSHSEEEEVEEPLEPSKKQLLEQLSELELATSIAASASISLKGARVPYNHSSYIDGLQQFISKLKKQPGIRTIHPGEITQGNTHCEQFSVKYQREAGDGAYYFVASKGGQRQDLRITPIKSVMQPKEFIENAIQQVLHPSTEPTDSHSFKAMEFEPNLNRAVAFMAAAAHRTQGAERAAQLKEQEKQRQHKKAVAEKSKKLKAKLGNKNEQVQEYAEKWVEWEKR